MPKYIGPILLFLALFGCEKQGQKVTEVPAVKDEIVVVYTPELNAVVEAEKAMTHDDRMNLFKQQIGVSEYIKNSNVTAKTKVDAAIAGVQGDYDWNRNKYPTVTEAIVVYLRAEGYGKGNVIEKESAAKLFRNLAEAVKKADK